MPSWKMRTKTRVLEPQFTVPVPTPPVGLLGRWILDPLSPCTPSRHHSHPQIAMHLTHSNQSVFFKLDDATSLLKTLQQFSGKKKSKRLHTAGNALNALAPICVLLALYSSSCIRYLQEYPRVIKPQNRHGLSS